MTSFVKILTNFYEGVANMNGTHNPVSIMADNDNAKKRKGKRITEININRINTFPHRLYEKTLIDIYCQKIKNGTLRI